MADAALEREQGIFCILFLRAFLVGCLDRDRGGVRMARVLKNARAAPRTVFS